MMPELFSPAWLSALATIVVIDLVLAGDNAIVIGLAARNVPREWQRRDVLWRTAAESVARGISGRENRAVSDRHRRLDRDPAMAIALSAPARARRRHRAARAVADILGLGRRCDGRRVRPRRRVEMGRRNRRSRPLGRVDSVRAMGGQEVPRQRLIDHAGASFSGDSLEVLLAA